MIEFDFSGQDPTFQQALLRAGFAPVGGVGGQASQPFAPAFARFAPQETAAPQAPFGGTVTGSPQSYDGEAGAGGYGGMAPAPANAQEAAALTAAGVQPFGFGTALANAMTMTNPMGIMGALGGLVANPQNARLGVQSPVSFSGLLDRATGRNGFDVQDVGFGFSLDGFSNAVGPLGLDPGFAQQARQVADPFGFGVPNITAANQGITVSGGGDASPGGSSAADDFGFDPSDDHSDQTPDPGDF